MLLGTFMDLADSSLSTGASSVLRHKKRGNKQVSLRHNPASDEKSGANNLAGYFSEHSVSRR